MSVAAIIPTIGRPELARAVRSVLEQTEAVHPIVVLDRPELAAQVTEQLDGLPHQLILTAGATGGAAARNIGVRVAQEDVIAFLDDDDEWLPRKTEYQLGMLRDAPGEVITSHALLVGKRERVVPEVVFANDQRMVDYLLDRSTLRLRKHFIQSSSILLSRELALSTPWRDELPRHQDWTLLIELERLGTQILTHPDPLVKVHQGSVASISRSSSWRASLDWLEVFAHDASSRPKADFLCSVAARSAVAAGDVAEARRILSQALTLGPHVAALALGAATLLRHQIKPRRSVTEKNQRG